mmetsp:Transcript_18587/g.22266  ORF Transcript_18587/g.22266 Transcript_18587/m.22266 type:complete len:216 (-) Transcript_18587:69-716(-)
MRHPSPTPTEAPMKPVVVTFESFSCFGVNLGSMPSRLAPSSMVPAIPIPTTSDNMFPRPAHASADTAMKVPMDLSMESPPRIMITLSIKPKPIIGMARCMNTVKSWLFVGSGTASAAEAADLAVSAADLAVSAAASGVDRKVFAEVEKKLDCQGVRGGAQAVTSEGRRGWACVEETTGAVTTRDTVRRADRRDIVLCGQSLYVYIKLQCLKGRDT